MSSERHDTDFYRRRGRVDKAQKFARFLKANNVPPEDIMEWEETEWEIWADQAGLHVPSEATRGMVWGLLIPLPELRTDPDYET